MAANSSTSSATDRSLPPEPIGALHASRPADEEPLEALEAFEAEEYDEEEWEDDVEEGDEPSLGVSLRLGGGSAAAADKSAIEDGGFFIPDEIVVRDDCIQGTFEEKERIDAFVMDDISEEVRKLDIFGPRGSVPVDDDASLDLPARPAPVVEREPAVAPVPWAIPAVVAIVATIAVATIGVAMFLAGTAAVVVASDGEEVPMEPVEQVEPEVPESEPVEVAPPVEDTGTGEEPEEVVEEEEPEPAAPRRRRRPKPEPEPEPVPEPVAPPPAPEPPPPPPPPPEPEPEKKKKGLFGKKKDK